MPALFEAVFALLVRFYLPIWRRYPSVIVMFKLRDRRNFFQWVCIGGAMVPIYLAVLYGAGGIYQTTDHPAAGLVACIAGISFFKMLGILPITIIRHGILSWREKRAARRLPAYP